MRRPARRLLGTSVMGKQLVYDYLRDCIAAYRASVVQLGEPRQPLDLFALLRAARAGAVPRSGEVRTGDGNAFRYRVHGSGYSLVQTASGRTTHFDACRIGDAQYLRFSIWSLLEYAASAGNDVTREAVQQQVREWATDEGPALIHVRDAAGLDYYCCPVSAI